MPRAFAKIVLTLENCLLTEEQLLQTPSRQDGLELQTEIDLRVLGCELIQTAGILLKLPQVAMATGQVLFQRFYYSKSFVRHAMETTAISCVCLASKIEEAPRRIRDVINVFHHIRQVRAQKPIHPMMLDGTYIAHKTQVIKAERRVLKELGFCVHVKHPHKLIVMYLQVLGYEQNQRLMQFAWNYMNDSLRTDVFMRHPPETIACACIYLTARRLALPLPNNPPWFGVFGVGEPAIVDVSYRIMELYRRAKPNVEQLEQAVDALCKRHMDSKQKHRAPAVAAESTNAASKRTVYAFGTAGSSTATATVSSALGPNAGGSSTGLPAGITTTDRNAAAHNAWGGFISRTLPASQTPGDPADPVAVLDSNATAATDGHAPDNDAGLPSANASATFVHQSANDHAPQKRSTYSPRSRSRTPRSRSRTPRSSSDSVEFMPQPQPAHGSRSSTGHKKSRHRSPSNRSYENHGAKKRSSRHYSRSPGSPASPSGSRHRKRDRHEKSEYYSGGARSERERDSRGNKERSDRDRSKHDRYDNRRSSSNQQRSSGKHRDRSRDRSMDRSRDRKR